MDENENDVLWKWTGRPSFSHMVHPNLDTGSTAFWFRSILIKFFKIALMNH